jgi:flagellin-like hook-associated protein FlgL
MSDITLTTTQRQTLLSLSQTTSLFNRTQERLNTGKKVNSVTDNAQAFFQAQSLSQRATTINTAKSTIDQSIQSVQAALTATSAVSSLLSQLQGVLESAQSGSLSNRISDTTQFKTIGNQLDQLVKDASFQGLNLLTSTNSSLSTQFSDRTAATLKIQGFNLVATATGGNARSLFTQANAFSSLGHIVFSNVVGVASIAAAGGVDINGFSQLNTQEGTQAGGGGTVKASVAEAVFAASINRVSNAISQLNAISQELGTNVGILQSRADFSSNYSNALTTGSNDLTLADLNTEAANSQALTLRQQLGIQSLTTSGTQNSSILTLLRGG